MNNTVIEVRNLSKQYRLGQIGTGSFSHDLNRWWHTVRGKEDPYLKIGETNDRSKTGESDYVWSLKDISFDIQKGDAVGIIGRNGAGKSTLLKILSRVTAPSTGSIKIKGRVASLLEVGTGFHPELSGRDNIFLNGAILGMKKHEVKRKFDEIVDFAGVQRYIDTPVKRYSSGMYVRLAFGVAAHLESEILIVDEVLAVGDAEFQKKCLGKMGEVSNKDGRTVLFVSHHMGAIAQLCNKGIFLQNGQLISHGSTSDIIAQYMNGEGGADSNKYISKEGDDKDIYFDEIATATSLGAESDDFSFDDAITLQIKIKINEYRPKVKIGIALIDKFHARVFTIHRDLDAFMDGVQNGDSVSLKVQLPKSLIAPNQYSFIFALFVPGESPVELLENKCIIKIHDAGSEYAEFEGHDYGSVIVDALWNKVI